MKPSLNTGKAAIMRNRLGTSETWLCIDFLLRYPNCSFLLHEDKSAKNIYQYAKHAGIAVQREKTSTGYVITRK